MEMFQSGCRLNHSTETALVKVINNIIKHLDTNKKIPVLLNLSTAFDKVDHKIIFNRLGDRIEPGDCFKLVLKLKILVLGF